MKLIFFGRSKIGNYCKENLKQFNIQIIDPNNFIAESLDRVDIVFYARNKSKIDFKFLLKIQKLNKNLRFVFLDTELNEYNKILINTTLLIKRIEFYIISKIFKNIERYYIPIVLGENMNWSNSLKMMSSNNIPLFATKKGFIRIVHVKKLILEIIEIKKINFELKSLERLSIDYGVELSIKKQSLLNKVFFYLKYNFITSLILLIKNQFFTVHTDKLNKKNDIKSVNLIDFYKLIIHA